MLTRSECLFLGLCSKNNIIYKSILRGETRRPDFYIYLSDKEILIEVKQLEENVAMKKDVAEIKRLLQINKSNVIPAKGISLNTSCRIRDKIKEGNKQFKDFNSSVPSILIIFDATTGRCLIDDEDIKEAMYGDLAISDPFQEFGNSEAVFSGNRQMTDVSNTSTSAIGVLSEIKGKANPELKIFHNKFAKCPLDVKKASQLTQIQFQIVSSDSRLYTDWTRVKID